LDVGICHIDIRAQSHEGVFATLERLRALPGVRTVESWAHLRSILMDSEQVG
jgi:hypothetical protein